METYAIDEDLQRIGPGLPSQEDQQLDEEMVSLGLLVDLTQPPGFGTLAPTFLCSWQRSFESRADQGWTTREYPVAGCMLSRLEPLAQEL